jgi:DNA repair protein RadC
VLRRRFHPRAKLDGFASAKLFFCHCRTQPEFTRETLWVAHLDAARNCVHVSDFAGDGASAPFFIRSIICDVIAHDSAGLLLAHNHPSGDPRPSASDYLVTRRLALVADALDCALLDHLIFAGEECTSFRTMGLL